MASIAADIVQRDAPSIAPVAEDAVPHAGVPSALPCAEV
jgi:hypothetical protein